MVLELAVVIAGVLAVFGSAERFGFEAELGLGGQREGFKARPALPEAADRVLGHRVLAVLGGDVNHLLAPRQGFFEERIKDPHGLPQTGGSLEQKRLARRKPGIDLGHQLELAGARPFEREDQGGRRLAPPGGALPGLSASAVSSSRRASSQAA